MNIAFSGWTGAGTTTAAMLTAVLLKRNYLYIGQLFRDLGERFGYANEGKDRVSFDTYIEPIIGSTIDHYVDYKLTTSDDIILESDLSGFRLGKNPKLISIFLTCDQDVRIKRTEKDGRQAAEEVLRQRDEVLKHKYHDLWQIDFYDMELIERKYNHIVNNSAISLLDEMVLIMNLIKEHADFRDMPWQKIINGIPKLIRNFEETGKQGLKDTLKKKGLLIPTDDILREIVTVFPEDVAQYPKEIQNIFLGLQ